MRPFTTKLILDNKRLEVENSSKQNRIDELEKKLDQALDYLDTSARNFLLDEWGKS